MTSRLNLGSIPAPPYLEDLNGSEQGRQTKIPEDVLVIGREPGPGGLKVVPAIEGISRRHVDVWCSQAGQTVIRDVGTDGKGAPGGTFINGAAMQPLKEYSLKDGDEIRLGPRGGIRFIFVHSDRYRCDDIVVNDQTYTVTIRGEEMKRTLTPIELRILKVLHDQCGQVVNRERVGSAGWWPDPPPEYSGINKRVQELREKLDAELGRTWTIRPIRGVGYRLDL